MFLDSWQRARRALRLLAIDPGLGGVVIRARAGPVRDALMKEVPHAVRRLHPAMSDEALFGGIDLSLTLQSGRVQMKQGLLSRPGPLILTMAERATPGLAARLAGVLDQGKDHTLLALDEGVEPDECVDPKLAERLAFHIDLSDVSLRDIAGDMPDEAHSAEAPPAAAPDLIDQITRIAAQLGIDSLRAPLFTLRAARANARVCGRDRVTPDDLELACQLTLAHRATMVPEPPPEPPEAPPPNAGERSRENDTLDLPDEMLLEAVRALLPQNLLDQLTVRQARAGRGAGTGAARRGNRRGRPLPARAGRLTDGARLDLIATLRAAAPWQTIRRNATGRTGLHIRPDDFRIKRFERNSDRLLIFAVDASGSAALTRLAEAKGAVELLLAQAYARRDHVALVAFRGTGAEVLLPPTRSLVQTKRRLAGLPGGGGTPLAAGMRAAYEEALQAARRGMTPTVAILTDGRANVTLDGTADRRQAATDARQIATLLRTDQIDSIVIDTGNRPEPALRNLAQALDATYLPLPRADAARLSASVAMVLQD